MRSFLYDVVVIYPRYWTLISNPDRWYEMSQCLDGKFRYIYQNLSLDDARNYCNGFNMGSDQDVAQVVRSLTINQKRAL